MASLPIWVHQAVLYTFVVISLTANSFLILLVTHPSNRNLGNYRVLLCTFATVDIAISIFHAITLPDFALIEYGFTVFSLNALDLPAKQGFAIIESYILLFYEPFVLVSFHFLYRLLSVTRPNALRSHFVCGIFLAICVNALILMMILVDIWITFPDYDENYFSDVLLRDYGVDMATKPNLVVVNYFHTAAYGGTVNWHAIVAMLNCGGVAALMFIFNGACAIFIVRKIGKSNISEAAQSLHLVLLRALIIQFSVPIVLCVIPFFLIIGLPLTGLPFGITGNVCGLMVSFFPVVDPICMILAYSKFRATLMTTIRRITGRTAPGENTTLFLVSTANALTSATTIRNKPGSNSNAP